MLIISVKSLIILFLFAEILSADIKLNGNDADPNRSHKIYSKQNSADLNPFRKGNKFGFSDKDKRIVIEPKYDDISPFSEGLAVYKLNKMLGYLDLSGKELTPAKFDFASELSRIVDTTLKEIELPEQISDIHYLNEGFILLKSNKKYGFINEEGEVIIPFKYDKATVFSEGLSKVKLNGKEFYISKDGTEYYEA